jgi:hypothetical protein
MGKWGGGLSESASREAGRPRGSEEASEIIEARAPAVVLAAREKKSVDHRRCGSRAGHA